MNPCVLAVFINSSFIFLALACFCPQIRHRFCFSALSCLLLAVLLAYDFFFWFGISGSRAVFSLCWKFLHPNRSLVFNSLTVCRSFEFRVCLIFQAKFFFSAGIEYFFVHGMFDLLALRCYIVVVLCFL